MDPISYDANASSNSPKPARKILVAIIAAFFFILALYFQSRSTRPNDAVTSQQQAAPNAPVESGCGQIKILQNETTLTTAEGPSFTCLKEAASSCRPTTAIVEHTIQSDTFVRTFSSVITLAKSASGCEMRLERGALIVRSYGDDEMNASIEKAFNDAYEHRTGVCKYSKNEDLVRTFELWDMGALPQAGSGADYGTADCEGEYFEPVILKPPALPTK